MTGQHRPPAAQSVGAAVLLQREAVLQTSRLIDLGVAQHRRLHGIEPSAAVSALQSLFHRASELALAEVEALRHLDVQAMAEMSPSKKPRNDEIGTREAAEILGLSPRQVARIARSLSGAGGSQGKPWRFSRADVETYRAAQQDS